MFETLRESLERDQSRLDKNMERIAPRVPKDPFDQYEYRRAGGSILAAIALTIAQRVALPFVAMARKLRKTQD